MNTEQLAAMLDTATGIVGDRFVWVKGIASNPDVWTLQDACGTDIAHIAPAHASDQPSGIIWWAIADDGDVLGTKRTFLEALETVNSEYRRCTASSPAGSIACDNGRQTGSRYCAIHQRAMATTPDPERPHLWRCGCLSNDDGAHRGGCPAYLDGRKGI